MSKNNKSKLNIKGIIGVALSTISFIIGYYLLNNISTMEKPPLGNTFSIIFGCSLIVLAFLGVALVLKFIYDDNKKRRHRKKRKSIHKLDYDQNFKYKSKTNTSNNE